MSRLRLLVHPLLRVYVVAALVMGAVLSPPALAFIPAVLAAGYLFLWWRPVTATALLLYDCFALLGLPVLVSQSVPGYLAWLAGVPALPLILRDLEVAAEVMTHNPGDRARSPTRVTVALAGLTALALLAGVALGVSVVIISASLGALGLGGLCLLAWRRMPYMPLEAIPVDERALAGGKVQVTVTAKPAGTIGGVVYLGSPYDWMTVSPPVQSLRGPELTLSMSLTPPLSGPSTLEVRGRAVDRWGLWQTRFVLKPARLHVIPRARYAAWLAKRYLAESGAGMLPLISTVGTIRPLFGLRAGVEYYGSQLYQPGDSLRNIDWKHSIKYSKLISKEFADLRGQPAVLLLNLAVADAEAQDKQVYNAVVAALSLAREQVPTAIAAYDEHEVQMVTPALQPQALVARCLDITQHVKMIGKPVKYLQPADVVRLRANIRRLQSVESAPAQALNRLLQVEYQNLRDVAVKHPVGKALAAALEKTGDRASVVVVSPMNHDAEAVMFSTAIHENRGSSVMVI